jgi:HAAS domain-containing protein
MTAQRGDELIGVYMARLGAALAGLPADRRDEIAGEIANHIAEERAGLSAESDADVHRLLARVGDPSEIAAAASAQAVRQPVERRIGAVEVLALVLTPIIWPVGVILLWLSPAWPARDKLIGTVFSLGGYPTILVLGPAVLLWPGLTATCGGGSVDGRPVQETCTGVMGLPQWEQTLIGIGFILLVVLVLLLPILAGIYLGVRLRRWAASEPRLAAA